MTGFELIEEISSLGFDSKVESRPRLYSIITFAMRTVAAICPRVSEHRVRLDGASTVTPLLFSDFEGFGRLCTSPVTLDGCPVFDIYTVHSDRIELSSGIKGNVSIRYELDIPAFTDESLEKELPVSSCVLHLLPLLCAAFYWQEDEEEKAEFYMQQYRYALSDFKSHARSGDACVCRNYNNW